MNNEYKPAIVATCPAGLGNRMKCMVSTIKNARANGKMPLLYWPVNDLCGCTYDDLFKHKPFARELDEEELDELKSTVDDLEINKTWKFTLSTSSDCSSTSSDCLRDEEPLDFKFNKLTQKQRDEFVDYFKEFEPTQEIYDVIDVIYFKYADDFAAGNVIGVHIRKGDYKVSFDGRQHISTEKGFQDKMKALLEVNPDYKFLLCTEDKETEEEFEKLFGKDKIIYFHKRARGRGDVAAMKEALIDLYLLSKCDIILGTFLSTFTEVAWWLGGCKANVCIIGEEDEEAVAKVWAKLPKPGESIVAKGIRRIKIWWSEGI